MDYLKFQTEDFVADAFFIKWVKSPNQEHIAFWSAFLSKHPECSARVEEARQIILLLDIREDILPEGKFIELWEGIIRDEVGVNQQRLPSARPFGSRVHWIYKVAATLLILVVCTLALTTYFNRTITIVTAYGESRTLFLPDSSKVTLNSNSQIQYAPNDFSNGKREIFLQGEAFFSIVHEEDHKNFIVYTEELNIEVLGTKFNVNSRRGKTQVVLQEGKVQLDLASSNKAPMVMKPGELVVFSEGNKNPIRKNVEATNYSAWKNNKLVFSRTSLFEIAQLLEDNYGYTVIFEKPEIGDRNFTGTSSSENLEELFEKIAIVFELDINQEGKTLTIQYTKENPK